LGIFGDTSLWGRFGYLSLVLAAAARRIIAIRA